MLQPSQGTPPVPAAEVDERWVSHWVTWVVQSKQKCYMHVLLNLVDAPGHCMVAKECNDRMRALGEHMVPSSNINQKLRQKRLLKPWDELKHNSVVELTPLGLRVATELKAEYRTEEVGES